MTGSLAWLTGMGPTAFNPSNFGGRVRGARPTFRPGDPLLSMHGRTPRPMNLHDIAKDLLAVLGTGRQLDPFSKVYPDFGLKDAYNVTAAVRAGREARGERCIGRKIGFTNRTSWEEYGVYAPIWGYVYEGTVHDLTGDPLEVSLKDLAEPRIEPEIIFGLVAPPEPGMDEEALIGCIDWIVHGF